MSILNTYLEKIRIKNYLSLHDVELPLKPLTVLVGPNASGKSNILEALNLLKSIMKNEEPPPTRFIKNRIWAGGAKAINFSSAIMINGKRACYTVELRPVEENRISIERLTIEGVEVINIKNGRGKVRDEDGSNETDYRSKKLALTSAGDCGVKPTTNALNEFMSNWGFYNFDPDMIRNNQK